MIEDPPGLGPDAKAILLALRDMQQQFQRDSDAKHDATQKEMLALSGAVKTAFPAGDFDGHRRYHELLIAREEQRQQIRREILTHLLKGSSWAMILGLFWMLVRSAKDYLK